MAKITLKFKDTTGTELTALFFQSPQAEAVTLRLYNTSEVNAASVYLTAVRGDLMESTTTVTGESTEVSNGQGVEIITDSWLEASTDDVTYTAFDSWTNKYSLGAIAAGAYVEFYVRLNPGVSYDSKGMVSFALGYAASVFAVLIDDDFEDEAAGTWNGDGVPSDWTNYSGAISGTEFVGLSDKTGHDGNTTRVFEITTRTTTTFWQFIQNYSIALDDDFTVQARVNPYSGGLPALIGVNHSGASITEHYSAVIFSSGTIYAAIGGDAGDLQAIGSYASESWYLIKIKHNLSAGTYDVYIDSTLAASGVAARPAVTPIRVVIGNAGVNSVVDQVAYFDDILVIKGA